MKKITNHLYKILGIAVCAAISYGFVQAQSASWTAPSVAAPGGNVSAPVHVGSTAQVKEGNLGVSGSNGGVRIFDRANAAQSWQWYANNDSATSKSWLRLWDHQNTRDALWATDTGLNVRGGVWTGNVYTSGLQITGGTPGEGKVLVSDVNGVARWDNPAAASNIRIRTEYREYAESTLYDPTSTCEIPGTGFPKSNVGNAWSDLNSDMRAESAVNAGIKWSLLGIWSGRSSVGKLPPTACSSGWGIYVPVTTSGDFDYISKPEVSKVGSMIATKVCQLKAGSDWFAYDVEIASWDSPGDNFFWFWSESQNRFWAYRGLNLYRMSLLRCARNVITYN